MDQIKEFFKIPVAGESGAVVGKSNRMVCGIIAILLGSLGIHNFMLGYKKKALIQLITTLVNSIIGYTISFLLMLVIIGFVTIWVNVLITMAISVWALTDGIFILTKKDYVDAEGNLLAD